MIDKMHIPGKVWFDGEPIFPHRFSEEIQEELKEDTDGEKLFRLFEKENKRKTEGR